MLEKGKIDLAMDSSNTPHLVFNDHSGFVLLYAVWNKQNWTITPIENSGGYGSLKLDSNG